MRRKKLGELLMEKGLITEEQLLQALQVQKENGGQPRLGKILVNLGFVTELSITEALSLQLGVPLLNLFEHPVNQDIFRLVPEALVRRHKAIPFQRTGDSLTVAMEDPLNVLAIDDLQLATGLEIDPAIAPESEIEHFISQNFGLRELVEELLPEPGQPVSGLDTVDVTEIADEEALIIRIVNSLIRQAIQVKASDIHLEPYQNEIRVRFRIDGLLRQVMALPPGLLPPLVSRIKILAGMDIAEKRLPQDGRMQLRIEDRSVNLRVATWPILTGEKVVIRILDKPNLLIKLDELGFSQDSLDRYQKLIRNSFGMILVTGPTGSGKSTTLYATLNEINTPEKNIVTIEDPVECVLPGINQMQVNYKAGLTFPRGLRSVIRQDPDIIMIGEIRDQETASIATRAAITGHLVFSTLHTNDAAGAVTRLLDMGIEPFLVASTVRGIVAQRLVRRICLYCRESYHPEPGSPEALFLQGFQFGHRVLVRGRGCPRCDSTGYSGRLAILEILPVEKNLRQKIVNKCSTDHLREAALASGMISLQEDGLRKALQGLTTISEVLRVAYTDGE
ncbi:MAG: Flp pilus assembly complex ATPase component TadA [Clostridia bacterium]|nr:Flp pilus assembly complex ATPase component TadA [Clostridia bacterium]